ncbi:MAG TPA: ABC transporter permease [Bacteroides sp.]|nr:ABC transporter permease [Bacteroides sp.]
MRKFIKYSFSDLVRSYWTIIYFLFFAIISSAILYFSADMTKSIVSIMNVVIVLIPLVSIIFSTIYYYNSREFTELLLAQPIKRSSLILGQYTGLALSLSLSFLAGVSIPFIAGGILASEHFLDFLLILLAGTCLSFSMSAIAYMTALRHENKILGFGISLFIWFFLAVLYDGLIMLLLVLFREYPTNSLAIVMTLLNPIDLSRVSIMLGLDISALMGYTGAVFLKFFGTMRGLPISLLSMLLWILVPAYFMVRIANKKDF